ncbi:MAG TPA: DNA polymerase/3'-5' exonuclease PolX [Chloroflexia bacterium]|nr:DNA polymerase/3'-5' exonuclease PolX [Chloroflexia bacterium]
MTNQEFARIFSLIGDLMELKGENVFKISAYRKAADTISNSNEEVATLWKENRVRELPGIGDAIAGKIDELMRTGHLKYLERLEEEVPPDLVTLLELPGIGSKTAMLLYKHLGIKGIGELEQAAREGRVAAVPGMGEKKQQVILKNIETLHRRGEKKILLGIALPCARQLMLDLMKADPHVRQIFPTGAIRRGEETVDQISLVAASDDTYETLEAFKKLPEVDQILKERDYKLEVTLRSTGFKVEFIACFPEQLATTLAMTTGTQEHRQELRDLARERGYELSLGGFVKGDEIWPAVDEEEVFRYLGLPYIPPELRNGRGEIKAAQRGKLALDLVTLDDIKGDLHSHSTWSDGVASIETMARAAAVKGYRYLLLTDHSKGLGIVRGLTEEKLKQQQAEIARINEVLAGEGFNFQLLSGSEVEIKADGSLDFPDEVLAQMDIVVCSLHSSLRQEPERITERLLRAMHNPHVDIIAHPTGRIINAREPAELDMQKVFAAARETGTALEINSGPDRLDLKAEHVRQALAAGVKLVISSDAHSTSGLNMLEYGVITARRGGATAASILNTLELGQLLSNLKH